jgi:succinyl-CoA synthetase beta subunit
MRLLEDQSKALLRQAGLPVPRGEPARSADDAARHAASLVGDQGRVAIKALVAAGRRGKAGAVAVCTAANSSEAAARILSLTLDQKAVEQVYVEEAVDIADEYYLAFAFGDLGPRVVASLKGGVDIETVADESPQALVSHDIDPVEGLRTWQAAALWDEAGAPSDQIPGLSALTVRLYAAFREHDAQMLEINPLVRTAQGDWAVVGTMMEIDDNALFRHPAWQAQAEESAGPGGRPLTPGERRVAEANQRYAGGSTRYIELDGEIGLLVSGGGASLYQHDLILHYGGRPANHTDFSPTPTPDKQVATLEAILDRPQVRGLLVGCNFLQLARCDIMMQALEIVLERRSVDTLRFPIVVRLFGPYETEARAIAARFPGINYLPPGTSLAQACQAIVEAVAARSPASTADRERRA